jgi:outer membrane protein TolC
MFKNYKVNLIALDSTITMIRFYFLIGLLTTLFSGTLSAQKVDYNAVILPSDAKGISDAEKLVQLAWQNMPQNAILENQLNQAGMEVKLANRNWLEQIRATGNLNEFTLKPYDPVTNSRALFFPRYNISASFSIGNFINDPLRAKIKKEEKEIAQQNINAKKLTVRAEVLRLYQNYIYNREVLKMRTDALETILSAFALAEQKFKAGEVTIQNYNTALDNLNTHRIQKLQAESNLAISKINLEELIGVRLETVINL